MDVEPGHLVPGHPVDVGGLVARPGCAAGWPAAEADGELLPDLSVGERDDVVRVREYPTRPSTLMVTPLSSKVSRIAVSVRDWDKVWEGIKTSAFNAWEGLKNVASTAWELIKSAVMTGIEALPGWLGGLWDGIKTKAGEVWDGIKTWASEKWEGIKSAMTDAIDDVVGAIAGIWTDVETGASTAWENIKKTASRVWEEVKSAIVGPIQSAWETISGIFDNISCKLDSLGSGANALTGDQVGVVVGGNARGGIISPGSGFRWVGEEGPELVRNVRGQLQVYNASRSQAMAAAASVQGGSTGLPSSLVVEFRGDGAITSEMARTAAATTDSALIQIRDAINRSRGRR